MCAHRSINRAVEKLIYVKFAIMINRRIELRNSYPTISNGVLGIIEHPKGTAPPFTNQKQFFIIIFDRPFDRRPIESNRAAEKVDKNCVWSANGETIPLKCSLMLNYQLEIVGDESVTVIDHYDELFVNLLFYKYSNLEVSREFLLGY